MVEKEGKGMVKKGRENMTGQFGMVQKRGKCDLEEGVVFMWQCDQIGKLCWDSFDPSMGVTAIFRGECKIQKKEVKG